MNQEFQTQQWPVQVMKDFLDKEEIVLLKKTILAKFSEEEQETFIRIVLRTRLDPWSRQIYATRRYQKTTDAQGQSKKVPVLVPVTSIMGLTAIADRTGNYKGCEIRWCAADGTWREQWLSDEPPAAAKCSVWHSQRMEHPEIGIARWMSYVGQIYNYTTKQWEITDFWERMPDFMLAKCAKAQALRGAFPDQLSNVYIREELESRLTDSELDTVSIPEDEEKIAANREAETRAKAAGVKFIQTKGERPTPEEAAEPAFEEDKPPIAPVASPPKKQVEPSGDELDLTPPKAALETPEGAPTPPAPWKTHVIQSVKHAKFQKRKIGDLSPNELAVIENQWLPHVRSQWEEATPEQRKDAEMFESAIAYHKMEKPW